MESFRLIQFYQDKRYPFSLYERATLYGREPMQTYPTPTGSFAIVDSSDWELPRGRTLKRKGSESPEDKARHKWNYTEKVQKVSGRDESARRPQTRPLLQSSLTERLTLRPTPPSSIMSRSRSRSQSPVRTTIRKLETATPPVQLRSVAILNNIQPPPAVCSLIELLDCDSDNGTIPSSLRSRFQAQYPSTYRRTAMSVFSDAQLYPALSDDEIWMRVQRIQQRDFKCTRFEKDENAWCQVVEMVLQLALDACASDLPFEINNIQTQSLDPVYLSRIRNPATGQSVTLMKKTDFAVGLDVEGLVEPETVSLSPMADAYTQVMPQLCPLEVKRPGGNSEEAGLQVMVWQAASLAHLQSLKATGMSDAPLPPIIGWTVEGPSWKFYIAWKEDDGRVMVVGPFAEANAGTTEVKSIFVLLGLWARIIKWFEQEYYPVYRELLQRAGETLRIMDVEACTQQESEERDHGHST